MKKNCWEERECGREQGGAKAGELGVCPAAVEIKLDGVHHGKFAGRTCWVVAGTFCRGEVQGTFAQKSQKCEQCEFYNKVRREEYPAFFLAIQLLKKLRVKWI
jgi:hypothetical protein